MSACTCDTGGHPTQLHSLPVFLSPLLGPHPLLFPSSPAHSLRSFRFGQRLPPLSVTGIRQGLPGCNPQESGNFIIPVLPHHSLRMSC